AARRRGDQQSRSGFGPGRRRLMGQPLMGGARRAGLSLFSFPVVAKTALTPPASPSENKHAIAAPVDVGLVPQSSRALLRATRRRAPADGEILRAARPGCAAQEARRAARLFRPVFFLFEDRAGPIQRIATRSKKCRRAASVARDGSDRGAACCTTGSSKGAASRGKGKAGFARGQDGLGASRIGWNSFR